MTQKKETSHAFLTVTRRKLVAELRATRGAEEELDQKIVILVRRENELIDVRVCLLLEDLFSLVTTSLSYPCTRLPSP